MNNYTGRQIAIFTDIHGLLEPTISILEDIKKRNINEIYSLGDNIGVGPNPSEVLDLLKKYNVKMINGNSEDYSILGIKPFESYFTDQKIESQKWTLAKLTDEQIEMLKNNKHSYDLLIGGKKVGLCHFVNDIRIDYKDGHNAWSYQDSMNDNLPNPQKQFYYTNSLEQTNEILMKCKSNKEEDRGYVSAYNDRLFDGKTIDYYDEIIEGHIHFKMISEDKNVKVRTIRAVALAYKDDPLDKASYIIIREKKSGYDIEEVLVPYDRKSMLESIDKSDMPNKEPINKFVYR